MTIRELQLKLLEAYSVANLNSISLTLINLFKNQQFTILQKITDIIHDLVVIEISADGKGFSKFMMLYHPDRHGYHTNEINRFAEQNNYDGLLGYSHILRLERLEEIASSLNSYEDIDYSPVYEWDMDYDGFRIITDEDSEEIILTKSQSESSGYTFLEAIKQREYGDINIDFPSYYLEDIEEFELSYSDIDDLEGVQFCIHAKSMDLSFNRITELTMLYELTCLEELILSNNQISFIDGLSNLYNLKSIELCDNYIEDISPLFELEKLEYADLSGNKIDHNQIRILIDMGVTVNFEY